VSVQPRPPRLALSLLRLTLPQERYETVSGDLEELFHLRLQLQRDLHGARAASAARAGRRWFWRQTLSVASTHVLPQARARARRGERMPASRVLQAMHHDVRYAWRALRKTPAFTVIAVLTLALGLGGSTAIFTLVQALLLKPLPFADPDQLMVLHITIPDALVSRGMPREMPWSYPQYRQLFAANQQAFRESTLFQSVGWTLTSTSNGGDDPNPESIRGELIDSHYLSTLGLAPQLGRDIRPDEDRAPGVAPIVLLSHALWQRRFGGDPGTIGRTISLNTTPHTIVGILPAGFRGLSGDAQLFVPILSSSNPRLADLNDPWSASFNLIARRKVDVSVQQAQSQVAVIGARHDAMFPPPAFAGVKGGFGAYAVPLQDARTDPLMRRAMLVLLGAVGLVLLIGCVNLANLMLTRALARQREVAIRLAIGATRGRVVRQFLTESLIVAFTGAAAGLLVAWQAMQLAAWLLPEVNVILPRSSFVLTRVGVGMIGLDLTTVLFACALAVMTALVFGFIPAWQASRADVIHTIKSGGAGSVGHGVGLGPASLGNILIVAETAIALVLLVAAGLMLTSVRNLQATRFGFQPDGLILSTMSLPAARYDAPHRGQYFARLLDDLRTQPGVQDAALAGCAPVSGGCNTTLAIRPDRPASAAAGPAPLIGIIPASPAYFQTLGIPLIKGRAFTDRDRAGQPPVVVINETAARRLWPGEDPIGKRLRLTQVVDGNGAEVIGIVADVRNHPVETAIMPDAYLPFAQTPLSSGYVFIRTQSDVAATTATLRGVMHALDPNLPIGQPKTMGNRFGEATWRTRLSAQLLTLFAALALLLAAIGLYGVMSQAVAQRTREIGVRMALGADRATIFRLVITRAALIASLGAIIGAGLSMLATPFLDTLLYQVRSNDPWTIAILAMVLIIVTLLASYVPARRATRVDPLATLRAD
jgi:putative ABC transport system permease protein